MKVCSLNFKYVTTTKILTLKKAIVIDMKGLRKYTDPIIMSLEEVEELGKELDKNQPDLYQRLLDETKPEDVALMVYTSGTTGPPKGAMLTHQNILNMTESFMPICPMYETDEVVSYLPLCHIAERVFSLIIPLYSGCTVNFAESLDTVQEALKEIYPTVFLGVPRIWEKPIMSFIGLRAFPAVILCGMDSIPGAIVGGLIIGVSENLAGGYLDHLLGGGVKEITAFVVVILIMMIRPYGLFGTKEIERV